MKTNQLTGLAIAGAGVYLLVSTGFGRSDGDAVAIAVIMVCLAGLVLSAVPARPDGPNTQPEVHHHIRVIVLRLLWLALGLSAGWALFVVARSLGLRARDYVLPLVVVAVSIGLMSVAMVQRKPRPEVTSFGKAGMVSESTKRLILALAGLIVTTLAIAEFQLLGRQALLGHDSTIEPQNACSSPCLVRPGVLENCSYLGA